MAAGSVFSGSRIFSLILVLIVGNITREVNQKINNDVIVNSSKINRACLEISPARRACKLPRSNGKGKRFLASKIPYNTNGFSYFNIERRLLTSGDIALNPGPASMKQVKTVKYPCGECERNVRSNQDAIACASCHAWFHAKCLKLSKDIFLYYLNHPDVDWICCTCALPNLSESFFDEDSKSTSSSTLNISDTLTTDSPTPIEWFKDNINGYYKKNLKIAHLNVNSIIGKADEVIDLLNECQFDILFISETKIDKSVSSMMFSHPQYRIIRRDRKKGAGGILVYIRNNVTAYRRTNLEPKEVESICLDVKGNENLWFILCACYRSPNKCKITDFINSCTVATEQMYNKRKEVIYIGDFNIDMLKIISNQDNTNELSMLCDQFCLNNLITEPTRVTASTKSLIDVILVSHPDRFSKSGNLNLGISDHDLIYTIRKQKLPKPKSKRIEFRTMKTFDQSAFLSDIENIPWDSAYVFDNVDDITSHWGNLFEQVIDKHAPVKQIQLRPNQLPWITPQIQKEIRRRNRLYKKCRKDKDDIAAWLNYKIQRNKVTKLKRNAIKDYFTNAAVSSKHSVGEFWKKVKPLLPNSKSKGPSNDNITLIENGKLIEDPASVFNTYFTTSLIDKDTLSMSEDDFANHPSVTSIKELKFNLDFQFNPVSSAYVTGFIQNIDIKKGCGPDGITPRLVKIASLVIAEPITNLFNHCISSSTWPKDWKLANVTPVYKAKEDSDKHNYRSINILSIIPKLFEKIKFDQMYEAFLPTFSTNMSGFLRNHSCCSALIKITDDWRHARDEKKEVGIIAIDLSKAFDSVCHSLLLAKMKAYGVKDSALKLIKSYLSERKQRVRCNGLYSDWLPIVSGVPQGSLLGPLLFNIMINDLNFVISNTSLRLYADDTTNYSSHINPIILEHNINQDLDVLCGWFKENFLGINTSKTQAMIIGKSGFNYNFIVGADPIETSNTLRILGVDLDVALNFKSHIGVMVKKAYAKIGALRRIKRFIQPDIAVRLYKAYILPQLEYCSPILIGIGKTQAKKLESVNHYAIKTLLNIPRSTDYETALELINMRTLEHRRYVQSLSVFFKSFKLNGPTYISDFFTLRETSYNLRNSKFKIRQPSYNTMYLHNSFSYIVSHLWNNLPVDIKETDSLAIFKKKLQNIVLSKAACLCSSCS